MSYVPDNEEEPPQLRRLRILVMVLIVVLILGIVTIAATIVIRLGFGGEDTARLGRVSIESIELPKDHTIVATGQGAGTLHVTLRAPDGSEVIQIFDDRTGDLLSKTAISRE